MINKELIKGSAILLFSFGLFNLLNFAYQFFMVRNLSVADYGILATLFSFVYIFLVFYDSVQLVIAKYSARERDAGKVKNIIKRSLKKSLIFAMIIFLVYLIISVYLSKIFSISYFLLALNGLFIFLVFFSATTRGVLQGKKRFFHLGGNMVLDAGLKLVLGAVLVFAGWRVYGAILGVLIGTSIAFVFTFFSIRDIIKSKERIAETDNIYKYTFPAFFITLIVALFYNIDVMLARVFFSAQEAGFYSIASTLSKIIFLGTQPISKAMFPISVENTIKKNKTPGVFRSSLLIIIIGIAIALGIFYLYPEFIVRIFSGKVIPESASILFYVGIAVSIISIANLNLIYKLSIGDVKNYLPLILFVIAQIAMLWYFSNNLIEFSVAFVTASVFFLWGTILFPKRQ